MAWKNIWNVLENVNTMNMLQYLKKLFLNVIHGIQWKI